MGGVVLDLNEMAWQRGTFGWSSAEGGDAISWEQLWRANDGKLRLIHPVDEMWRHDAIGKVVRRSNITVIAMWATFFIIMLFMLAACSAPSQGMVTEKRFWPDYTSTDWDCVSFDKKGFCNLRVPHSTWHPAEYQLCLYDEEHDERGCRYVDLITWHQYEKGQMYP